ncbi:hypothetical protein [Corynebacterium aquatimens]|uniref:ABC-type uncharacterized transport system ATPase subunit n=1 Tax=Corynebacterium aquatimens TaxID=1190508 RepID=A0A931GS43_9CORY|nr:hypothetical protein [Corynebacterium aquatimens]MBG6122653.1 ABC-type uncharacterized transport system ATPase subunit [Corynebacterium aquatimens]WJY64809.1 hypothetical protein CAQUA_00290 [Corynebacterium aquatimens]
MDPVLRVHDLAVTKTGSSYAFDAEEGLNILINDREAGSSTLALALAGRFRPTAGSVDLLGSPSTPKERFSAVALAGKELIDDLDRLVPVRDLIREQISWSQRFFVPVPRHDLLQHSRLAPWVEDLELSDLDVNDKVGDLHPTTRLQLRVLLALVARPDARLLIVDDVDQLRSLELRDQLLGNLSRIAEKVPVLALTVNDVPKEFPGEAPVNVIDLRGHHWSTDEEELA